MASRVGQDFARVLRQRGGPVDLAVPQRGVGQVAEHVARQRCVAGAEQQLQRPHVQRLRPGEVAPEVRGQGEHVERMALAQPVAVVLGEGQRPLGQRLGPGEVALDRRKEGGRYQGVDPQRAVHALVDGEGGVQPAARLAVVAQRAQREPYKV